MKIVVIGDEKVETIKFNGTTLDDATTNGAQSL